MPWRDSPRDLPTIYKLHLKEALADVLEDHRTDQSGKPSVEPPDLDYLFECDLEPISGLILKQLANEPSATRRMALIMEMTLPCWDEPSAAPRWLRREWDDAIAAAAVDYEGEEND